MAAPAYEDKIYYLNDYSTPSLYYVYVFWDGDKPFYVGLGQKNRWRRHFHNTARLEDDNSYKFRKMQKMFREGNKVGVEIVADGLTKEDAQALEIELITNYRRKCDGGTLTNLSSGGESGSVGTIRTDEWKEKRSFDARGQNSKATEELVYKAKLLYHYRGMTAKEIADFPEFSHLSKNTVEAWIGKSNANYSYVAPHLKCEKELWDEKAEESRGLHSKGFNYTQTADILGLGRNFVSRACRGLR